MELRKNNPCFPALTKNENYSHTERYANPMYNSPVINSSQVSQRDQLIKIKSPYYLKRFPSNQHEHCHNGGSCHACDFKKMLEKKDSFEYLKSGKKNVLGFEMDKFINTSYVFKNRLNSGKASKFHVEGSEDLNKNKKKNDLEIQFRRKILNSSSFSQKIFKERTGRSCEEEDVLSFIYQYSLKKENRNKQADKLLTDQELHMKISNQISSRIESHFTNQSKIRNLRNKIKPYRSNSKELQEKQSDEQSQPYNLQEQFKSITQSQRKMLIKIVSKKQNIFLQAKQISQIKSLLKKEPLMKRKKKVKIQKYAEFTFIHLEGLRNKDVIKEKQSQFEQIKEIKEIKQRKKRKSFKGQSKENENEKEKGKEKEIEEQLFEEINMKRSLQKITSTKSKMSHFLSFDEIKDLQNHGEYEEEKSNSFISNQDYNDDFDKNSSQERSASLIGSERQVSIRSKSSKRSALRKDSQMMRIGQKYTNEFPIEGYDNQSLIKLKGSPAMRKNCGLKMKMSIFQSQGPRQVQIEHKKQTQKKATDLLVIHRKLILKTEKLLKDHGLEKCIIKQNDSVLVKKKKIRKLRQMVRNRFLQTNNQSQLLEYLNVFEENCRILINEIKRNQTEGYDHSKIQMNISDLLRNETNDLLFYNLGHPQFEQDCNQYFMRNNDVTTYAQRKRISLLTEFKNQEQSEKRNSDSILIQVPLSNKSKATNCCHLETKVIN